MITEAREYTKHFDCWIHAVVMLYAVMQRFDSLREITASLLAETRKLAHLSITFKIGRKYARRCQQKTSGSHIRGHLP